MVSRKLCATRGRFSSLMLFLAVSSVRRGALFAGWYYSLLLILHTKVVPGFASSSEFIPLRGHGETWYSFESTSYNKVVSSG